MIPLLLVLALAPLQAQITDPRILSQPVQQLRALLLEGGNVTENQLSGAIARLASRRLDGRLAGASGSRWMISALCTTHRFRSLVLRPSQAPYADPGRVAAPAG